MSIIIKRKRARATKAQNNRCCYCGLIMCEGDPAAFARDYSLTIKQAALLLVTAEHLIARRDGGTNAAANIAAAHLWCNRMRHRRKAHHTDKTFRTLVVARVAKGRWFEQSILTRLISASI